MKRLALLAALVCAAPTATASAGIVTLTAEAHGGAGGGKGVGGDLKEDAFFSQVTGGTYGAILGVELLFVNVWIQHDQFIDGDGFAGTWTQFMAGADIDFEVGGQRGDLTKESDEEKWTPGYGELGMAVGFGVGTDHQVEPPLDNGEITDKAFLFQVSGGFGYRFSKLWSVGVSVPVQIGYMLRTEGPSTANDLGTHYTSLQGAALVNLRFSLSL